MPAEIIERRQVFNGRVVRLELHIVRLADGRSAEQEVVVHRPSVGMLPVDEQGRILLVRQFRAPAAADLLEIPIHGVLVSDLGHDQLGIAVNDGQQIVEVVRDAPSESPYRFEFLGLAELLVALAQGLLGALALFHFLPQLGIGPHQRGAVLRQRGDELAVGLR